MRERVFNKRTTLASLILAYFALMFDSYIVLIALPTITKSLHITIVEAGWILLIGILFRHSSQVVFGRGGDVYGRKKVFLLGLLGFAFGSLFCGLAPGYVWLLAARAIQGLAAGMIEANFSALATMSYPDEERGRALGIGSAAISAAAVLGLLAGGIICSNFNYRLVFFLSIPLSLAGLLLCYYTVPESRGGQGEPIDIPGALLLVMTLAPLGLVLSHERAFALKTATGLFLVAGTCVAFILLLLREKSARYPLLDRSLFKIPSFTMSNIAYLTSVVASIATYYAAPFFLEYSLGIGPERTGFILIASVGTSMLILMPSGIASDRIGTIPLEASGLVLQALSYGMLAFGAYELSLFMIVVSMVVLGLGNGLFASPNYSAVMGSSPKASLGVAGGVYGTMETIGAFMGIAVADDILGRLASQKEVIKSTGAALGNPTFEAATRNVFLVAFILVLVGLGITLLKYAMKYKETVRPV